MSCHGGDDQVVHHVLVFGDFKLVQQDACSALHTLKAQRPARLPQYPVTETYELLNDLINDVCGGLHTVLNVAAAKQVAMLIFFMFSLLIRFYHFYGKFDMRRFPERRNFPCPSSRWLCLDLQTSGHFFAWPNQLRQRSRSRRAASCSKGMKPSSGTFAKPGLALKLMVQSANLRSWHGSCAISSILWCRGSS